MSFDLVDTENRTSFRPMRTPEAGAWDNFLSGTGRVAMRGFAEAGRAGSMALAGGVRAFEKLGEMEPFGRVDTTLSDRMFRFHDDVFQRAVDYWTPKPGEVGAAAEIAGSLLSTLPLVMASPAAAVATTQLSAAENLLRKGVSPDKAQAVGAVQGAGLGLGIWMPMLGTNLWQRAVVGGAGFNVLQGAVTRGVSGSILDGTPAADDFRVFDWTALTLDALLGLAFGGMAHLSPAQRKQGENAWKRIHEWVSKAKPSEVDALVALRQAQHLNEGTAPGKLRDLQDVDANTRRARQALEQALQNKPVEVSDQPEVKFDPDPVADAARQKTIADMAREAERLGKAYDIVVREPLGPVNDPMVVLTPESIGEVIVERGPAFLKKGSATLKADQYGLVKFIWKHGEKSTRVDPEFQVTRDDIMRTPEVLRDFEPISDKTFPDGRREVEWQVERADGKKVLYSVRRFTDADGKQHLVTVFVNDGSNKRIAAKPMSEKANRPAGSPDGASTARGGDTARGSSALDTPGGQKGGSDEILRPAGADGKADPLAAEAARIVAENPDFELTVGKNADGSPITMKAKDFLEQAQAEAKTAAEDAKLLDVAAACMLGVS